MPSAFVTGATGFVGFHLLEALRARGWEVTACHRPSSRLELIRRWQPRLVVADIVSREAVFSAMPERPDVVFHAAASLEFWRPRNAEQTQINVEGTRNVVEAALARQAGRFIHVSSVAAWGPGDGDVIGEATPSKAAGHPINYYRSKWLAEQEVERGLERGLQATFINPAVILGPYDSSGWSRAFTLVQQGRLPFAPPGGASFCHVREVARALVNAVDQGGVGARYILAGADASYGEMLRMICELLGRPAPRVAPAWAFAAAARVGDLLSKVTGKPPDITPDMAQALNASYRAISSKAQRELGYEPVTLRQMLQDTFAWLRAEGRV